MIPKEIKYNLHYDDVRGDFFTAATRHSTSYSRISFLSLLLLLLCIYIKEPQSRIGYATLKYSMFMCIRS